MGNRKPVNCGCGGEAQTGKSYSGFYGVECINCGIQSGYYDTEAEAVQAWDRAMGVTEMSDLISREKLISTIRPMVGMWEDETFWINYERVVSIIESVEPEERTAKVEMLLCGNCHESNIFDVVTRQHYKYCPSCGCRLEWE